MAVDAHHSRFALADLALTLDRACEQAASVCDAVARAGAAMIGDGAGVQLLGDDGRYAPITVHHPDPERSRQLAAALDRGGRTPDDEYFVEMLATRRPIVLTPMTPERLDHLGAAGSAGIEAAVLCPVVVEDGCLGYVVLARTTPGSTYSRADVELARDIAGELALALSSARYAEKLRITEQRYRQVLETMPEGVLQLDPTGHATYANEPMGVLLGLPRDQLGGLGLHGFLDDRGKAELARWVAECRAGRGTVGATRLIRADGSARTVRISMMPLTEEQGDPGGILCLLTDTTDHIDAKGLKRQLDHLRRLDSLGQLIGGISHDFNNLLTVIAGSADMLAAATDPDSTEHHLANDIVNATGAGRTLIHQLLAFGRSDGNRPETIPVADLFADVQPLFSRILGEHIGLDLTFGPDVSPLRAERGPLEQALVNLAANARDAMLRGGVLRVAANNAEGFVHLTISDTGDGMDAETRRRAFEPFYSSKASGAGLGLATTAAIIRGLGGRISLESEPRMGTTVHLHLPAADPPSEAGTRPAAPVGHVLVVEDQPDVATLVQRFVERAGYGVTVATDAVQAVAQVAAGAPVDLLITDVVMPSMTGPELAAALREHHPDLPVVFMSGYTAAALGPQIHLDGNSLMVEKPFHRSTLLSAISRLSGVPAGGT